MASPSIRDLAALAILLVVATTAALSSFPSAATVAQPTVAQVRDSFYLEYGGSQPFDAVHADEVRSKLSAAAAKSCGQ